MSYSTVIYHGIVQLPLESHYIHKEIVKIFTTRISFSNKRNTTSPFFNSLELFYILCSVTFSFEHRICTFDNFMWENSKCSKWVTNAIRKWYALF